MFVFRALKIVVQEWRNSSQLRLSGYGLAYILSILWLEPPRNQAAGRFQGDFRDLSNVDDAVVLIDDENRASHQAAEIQGTIMIAKSCVYDADVFMP